MNRRERRAAERELRKAIKSGVGVKVGVKVGLAGYRVVRADGTVKLAVGRQPAGEGVRS